MLKNYPDILNVKELSQILRIGRNAAYALVNSGAVTSRRVGKKYLIPKKSVLDFLKEKGYNESVGIGNSTLSRKEQ